MIRFADPDRECGFGVAMCATQVAASVILTAILTPLLTAWSYRRLARTQAVEVAKPQIEEAATP